MSEGNLFVALDVSLEKMALCVMAADGSIGRESVVVTDAEAIADAQAEYRGEIVQVGLEPGPMTEWLVRGLEARGIPAVPMETRQVRAALSAMIVKTGRKDARGMANLLRMGSFRPVHVKTRDAREQKTLFSARATLVARLKGIGNSIRGLCGASPCVCPER